MTHHAMLMRTVRSFSKHDSLAGGTGRAPGSFSALGSPCRLQHGAGKKHGNQQRQFIHNILKHLRKILQQTAEKYHIRALLCLLKGRKARGHEMQLPAPPASSVRVTLLTRLVNCELCTYIPEQIHTNIQSALLMLLQSSSQHQITLTISL